MGLRERKKERTRALLLEKSKALFESNGYHGVTTAEIARSAGIAEGTLFNYFRNKGELFTAAVFPATEEDDGRANEALERIDPQRLAAAIAALLDAQWGRFRHTEKRMLRDYFAVVYGGGRTEAAELQAGLFAADERWIGQVAAFLSAQKAAHNERLNGLRTDMAAACIFGCAATLFTQYILTEERTYDELLDAIREQIAFVLTGHIGDGDALYASLR